MKTSAASPNPESPTTARPLDFDDESQESGVISAGTPPISKPAPQLGNSDDGPTPPPKPPRPLSPRQQAENTLKEAFPSVEAAVVKAVLVASDGNVERAFHALLGRALRSSLNPDSELTCVSRHDRSHCTRRDSSCQASAPISDGHNDVDDSAPARGRRNVCQATR
jgi:hypothetical protein